MLVAGLAVPEVVDGAEVVGVGVGESVPAGVRLDGVGELVGTGAAGEFDSQLTVTVTPPMSAVFEAATVVVVAVGVWVGFGVASNSVYNGNVNPGCTPLSTPNFIGEMFRYFFTADFGTHSNVGRMCCRATKLR